MQRLLSIILLSFFTVLLTANSPATYTQVPPVPTTAPRSSTDTNSTYIRSDRLGITFISSADDQSDIRYRRALELGAGWNRWPLYWNQVEREPGQFNWAAYDRLVVNDIQQGLQINAILLGNPSFHIDGNRPAGLNEPIFADGTDTPGDGKTLNPNNPWVNYVAQSVERYKPGGILAQEMGWLPTAGIRVWEVWNEPDHEPFWQGSIRDYARLLKSAYIVIHLVDPAATVMFGGLLYSSDDNWLARVLAIFEEDPAREQYNWYMDAVAVHSYGYPWRSGWLALWTNQTLKAYNLKRPIWMNETGVPVWDDYPGPVWAIDPEQRLRRATAEQQAWYFIQSTAYALAGGVDKVFFHQLYDDCGDQPAGTNFPPHNGELCVGDDQCFGDAFGLYRNPTNAVCFSQHPTPNSARPVAAAFRLTAEILGAQPLSGGDVDLVNEETATIVSFVRPDSGERILVIWNRTFDPVTVEIEPTSDRADLRSLTTAQALTPDGDDLYRVTLLPAVNDFFPTLEPGDLTAIGGPPVFLIERFGEGMDTPFVSVETTGASGTPSAALQVTPGAIVPPPAQPTLAPEEDTLPPVTYVEPLPEVSPPTFTIRWLGEDNSGIDRYFVWVRVNGGEWTPWLETARTEADYTGESGNLYEFAVWAIDLAGNWSLNINVQPQAGTRVG